MSANRRRVAYAAGLVIAGAAAVTAALISSRAQERSNSSSTSTSSKDSSSLSRSDWGQIAIVVSTLDNYQALLDSHPSLMLVGTRSTKLRGKVKKTDEYRVIETETDNGWEHIVKHLRPDTVILSQGLTGDNIGNFTQRVLLMEDAYQGL